MSGSPILCGGSLRSWQREIERSSLIDLRFDPDPAAVALDDPLADRKANPRAGDRPPVQPLEDPKNDLVICGCDSDPVISEGKPPHAILVDCGNMDARCPLSTILEGVTDQVLEKLNEMGLVSEDDGQVIAGDAGLVFLDR